MLAFVFASGSRLDGFNARSSSILPSFHLYRSRKFGEHCTMPSRRVAEIVLGCGPLCLQSGRASLYPVATSTLPLRNA
jgi:hypothetical protein